MNKYYHLGGIRNRYNTRRNLDLTQISKYRSYKDKLDREFAILICA